VFSRRQFICSAVAAAATTPALSTVSVGEEDAYPSGPIRSICPFGAGSGADVKVRFYANKLSALCGKPVIVENKPGAIGNIATEAVARSKPDGYTIYIAPGSSTLAAAPSLFKKLGYDPINDFSAFVMCVAGDSPFKTVADLTAYLKDKGDAASYGSIAPPGLVSSEIYKVDFGLKTVEVKYKEQGSLLNDLASGQIAFTHIDYTTAGGQIKSGRLRGLAMTSAKRLASVPDVPGAEEAGIPNMNVLTWWSVHVPAHTPKPICDKLETWFNTIAIDPDTVKFNAGVGSDVLPGNSQMLKEMLLRDTKAWAEYVRIAKIQPE